jgi:hypothetical protein
MTPHLRRALLLSLAAFWLVSRVSAADRHDAERAARAAAQPLEKLGFSFRADVWSKELKPDVGKAVRVQLFKGNEYRFIIAVPPASGAVVGAAVLDFAGKVASSQVGAEGESRTVVLAIEPKQTGVYLVAMHLGAGGAAVPVCLIAGYK